jgi:hypothetical protein
LDGKVVVVALGDDPASVVRSLAGAGAAVVLVAPENDPTAGRLAGDLSGTRTAVFTLTGDEGDVDALVEMLGELFANRP